MKRIHTVVSAGLMVFCVASLNWLLFGDGYQITGDFDGQSAIESITVKVNIGSDGEDLQEPVALDLGLGFPLWLHPVGRHDEETLPFGAVCQSSTATSTVAAGQSATFTFNNSGDPGLDHRRSTEQLLKGVRIADISRIGFTSQGSTEWVLGGYEISINGRLFVANDSINVRISEAQEAAAFRLAELDLQVGPLEQELTELKALEETGLADESDLTRLQELDESLGPLLAEKRRLEAQRNGLYPWYEELEFSSPWRVGEPVQSASVSVETQSHPGADTDNYVYFATGGHKYLLGSPEQPLSGVEEIQEFELDVLQGPLTAADLRGFSLGMLAHGQLNGQVPDRWHPRRLVVEIDGRIVYDSEESELDRRSLEAIRLIPPAHIGDDGSVVVNIPIERETFVWTAGSALGLDLEHGGAAAFPSTGDELYPEPETGLLDWETETGVDAGVYPDFPEYYPPFPGEYAPGGGWGPEPWWGPDSGAWDQDWDRPPRWLRVLFWLWWFQNHDADDLPNWLDDLINGSDEDEVEPDGEPFQVDNVRITQGWRYGDEFRVEWDISGDEGEIDHYEIELLPIRPENINPISGPSLIPSTTALAGSRSTGGLHPTEDIEIKYLMPKVTAIPVDPEATAHSYDGPARAIFSHGSRAEDQFALGAPVYVNPDGTFSLPPTIGPPPEGTERAIWFFGREQGHIGLVFENATPGYNIALLPHEDDTYLMIPLRANEPNRFEGKRRVVAHVGFLGDSDIDNSANVSLRCTLQGDAHHIYDAQEFTLETTADSPQPFKRYTQEVDTADGGPGTASLIIHIHVYGGVLDPAHPPAIFGLRVEEVE
jgi:hypothetical protein